jgi:glycosyltransferase involved in cell wall biosynthesis
MSTEQIRIVGKQNRVGLDRDIEVVTSSIEAAGMATTFRHYRDRMWWRAVLPGPVSVPAQIFVERAFPRWRRSTGRSFLIPNQERFPTRHLRRLNSIDAIFAKTRHAAELFSRYHGSVVHTGFTSPDRKEEGVAKDWKRFLHLAGRSTVKGTDVILDIWNRHPEWPTLHLVQSTENAPKSTPSNVTLHSGYLDDRELQRLQNQCGIHLCPSRCEGWGHYIAEGLSCGAVVVTTDAPPMNELVTEGRGRLVPWDRSAPRHLGTCYYVSAPALEESIERLLQASEDHLARLGDAARRWFQENDARFRNEFPQLIETLLAEEPGSAP